MVGIPKGTRDFGPEVMVRRNYIFGVIKNIFERYGYLPLETPTMENLSTLTGKYGDEGDQLIFKVLNSGDTREHLNLILKKYNSITLLTASYASKILSNLFFKNTNQYNQDLDLNYLSSENDKGYKLLDGFISQNSFNVDSIEIREKILVKIIDILKADENSLDIKDFLAMVKSNHHNEYNITSAEFEKAAFYWLLDVKIPLAEKLASVVKTLPAKSEIQSQIIEKALRYDLTVPFARFVVMNHNQLALPFKRYQIQPVWRADRPQKGRYREFYQCDVDVVGSNSLINEVELIQIFDDVLTQLGLPDFTIKINNRKLLTGLAALTGAPERMMDMTVAIDKLDKIGVDGVKKELLEKGFSESQWNIIESVLTLEGSNDEKLERMKTLLGENEIALKGIEEMQFILNRVKATGLERAKLELDLTLARGLNYYTGAIFEVKANGVQMGSICGGGRYDDLTGIFGLPGLSGVGISFGADRIYDVMMELNLFPTEIGATTKILFTNFGEQEEMHILPILRKIRQAGINAEIYPEAAKMKKQFKYADDKKIPFVGVLGTEEIQKNLIALKNMSSGEQDLLTLEQVIEKLK